MTRAAILLSVASMLGAAASAPFQCGSSADSERRLEDTAGDGLWALAEDFGAKGDANGRRATLQFLVDRYPSNRHAEAARAELGRRAEAAEADAATAGAR